MTKEIPGIMIGISTAFLVACTYIPPSDDQPPVLPPQSADPLQCTNVDACQPPQGHDIIKNDVAADDMQDSPDSGDKDNSAPVVVPPGLQKGG